MNAIKRYLTGLAVAVCAAYGFAAERTAKWSLPSDWNASPHFDAVGGAVMTIGGGTDEAALDTTGIAQGNQDRTQASSLTVAGNGVLKLGTGGIRFCNANGRL